MEKQRGSILVFTMITVSVLMIVGLTFTTMTTTEYRTAAAHTSSIQALYVAEAGLSWVKHGLENGSITPPTNMTMGQEFVMPTSTLFTDIGDVKVSFVKTAPGWDVVAEGKKGGAKKIVKMKVEVAAAGPGGSMLGKSLFGPVTVRNGCRVVGDFTASSVDLDNSPSLLIGNVEVAGDRMMVGNGTANVKIIDSSSNHLRITEVATGQWTTRSPVPPFEVTNYPVKITGHKGVDYVAPSITLIPTLPVANSPSIPAEPPVVTPSRPAVNAAWNPSPPHLFPGTGTYPSITVSSTLNINVPDDTDVIIRTDSLTVTGQINITGSGKGRVIFHVRNTLSLTSSGSINAGGAFDRVDIYYYGPNPISFGGAVAVAGSLISRTATITITSSAGVQGHIITGANKVDVTGDAKAYLRVVYAPNADINVANSGELRGVVVGKSLSVSGRSLVEFDSRAANTFGRFVNPLGLWAENQGYILHTWTGK